jgi:hypothetical protein
MLAASSKEPLVNEWFRVREWVRELRVTEPYEREKYIED